MKKVLFGLLIATVVSGTVSAMSALEFLRVETDNREAPVMKEIVIKLVGERYKGSRSGRIVGLDEAEIIQKGYTTQDIEQIAEEAAFAAGMTR